jgi:hypothetical protein
MSLLVVDKFPILFSLRAKSFFLSDSLLLCASHDIRMPIINVAINIVLYAIPLLYK